MSAKSEDKEIIDLAAIAAEAEKAAAEAEKAAEEFAAGLEDFADQAGDIDLGEFGDAIAEAADAVT